MRATRKVLLSAAVSLGILLPSSSEAQRLIYVVPDFYPVAMGASPSCTGVDFTVHRIPGLIDADLNLKRAHDVTTRIILDYPVHGGYRTAIVGATTHDFARGEHTHVAYVGWALPPDADLSGVSSGRIAIVADPDGRVLEGNEWNNVSSITCG